jgi:ubiquinone biosynthesis protein COQ9
MSDGVRERVLQEALPLIPQSGFNDATLKAAAEKASVGPAEWKAAFPNGAASLAEAFSHWADAEMEEKLRLNQAERMRDRVAAAVRARIEVLVPHKEATRRAAAFLALPQHAPLAATLMMRSVDKMWRTAGDRSSDFSYYTKRGLLSGVYGATFVYWLSDSSEGHAETWKFLANRIDNVMEIEKFRGAARDALAKLPDPLGIFGAFKGRR